MPDDGDATARAQALRVAIGRVARRMRQIYATHEADEPTFNEIALLVHLARDGPATPTEIARGERITSQAIAPAIRELQARGLLDRSRHPRDGRSTVLTVTAAGRTALANRELAVVARLVQALQDDLTPADRERLEAVVPVLNKLADSL
jgi:DNA-binding MarR family transcriptional regulator